METVTEQPIQETPSNDPFSLDEAKLASLSPEQRASLDPIFDEWKSKAKSEIDRTTKTYTEKYKPLEEKAQALDGLIKDPRFVQWWNNLQTAAQSQGVPVQQPQDFATPEEWQQAVSDAYSGNGEKMKEIQARMWAVMATPVVRELKQKQEELSNAQDEFRTTQSIKDMFERHPEAKELDAIGRDPDNPESESLLEVCLNWADANGKSLEEGFQRAKTWSDALRMGAKQEAMGLVQEKRNSTLSGSSTNTATNSPVVEVADADELMQRNMEAVLDGKKPPRFVIKGSQRQSQWTQKA